MMYILIPLIVTIQIKEHFPKVVSLMNLNGMVVVDEIAEQMNENPQLIAYPCLQLLGDLMVNDLKLENVDNFDKTFKEFERNIAKAVADDNKDKTAIGNGDTAAGNGIGSSKAVVAENPNPENESDVKEDTSKVKSNEPEDMEIETQIEANLIKVYD